MKTLQNIKRYATGFIIGVALVSGVAYGASNGSIGALFEASGPSWIFPGQHIKNQTVTPNKIDPNGDYTMNSLTTTYRVDSIYGTNKVSMIPNGDLGGARLRVFGGSNYASLRALSDSNANVYLGNQAASKGYGLEVSSAGTDFNVISTDRGEVMGINLDTIRFGSYGNDNLVINSATNTVSTSGKIEAQTAKFTGNVESQAFLYTSDKRLKENIETIQDPISKVNSLRGVTWNWKKDGKADVGFIAQEVESVFPELVATKEDGYKSVQYANLVGVLVEAVKEQQKQIDVLTQKVEALESR